MNNNIVDVFEKIKLVSRYTELCSKYDDFLNRKKNVSIEELKALLDEVGFTLAYHKDGGFFSFISSFANIESTLNLTFKGGIVEPLLYIKINGKTVGPHGRLDFISEEMDPSYNRSKYNLAKFTNLEELKNILILIFSIYWDINSELISREDSLLI